MDEEMVKSAGIPANVIQGTDAPRAVRIADGAHEYEWSVRCAEEQVKTEAGDPDDDDDDSDDDADRTPLEQE
jgi:hypothetical protein